MNDSNYINTNIEESSKLNNLQRFEKFNAQKFLIDKVIAVEKVIVDSHIKLLVRIIEDNTQYEDNPKNLTNKDKILTLIIDESIAEYINIVNIIGKKVEVNNLSNDAASMYDINSLNINVTDIDIKEEIVEGFQQKNKLTKADYRLVKTSEFKDFNYDKFLNYYSMKILTIYPQSPKIARAIILITDSKNEENQNDSNIGKTFSVKLEMDEVRNIPVNLLIGNKNIDKHNFKGSITGTIVKNNQVLLVADKLEIQEDNTLFVVGKIDKKQYNIEDINTEMDNTYT